MTRAHSSAPVRATPSSDRTVDPAAVTMSGLVPVGMAADGTVVAAAAIDYAVWDEKAAAFAQRQELGGAQRALLSAGNASSLAWQGFDKAGLTLRSGLRP